MAPESFTVRAAARIDRTEFGVTASRGLAGRYLDLTLEVRLNGHLIRECARARAGGRTS